MRKDDIFWIWLSLRLGENRACVPALFQVFATPYDVYSAEPEDLERVSGLSSLQKTALADKSLYPAQQICDWCRDHRAGICRYGQEEYPKALMTIKNPPLILYVQGHLPNLSDKLCVGVVGTRNCTEYGAHTAYKISYELATAGAVIVSGMAKGIDGIAAAGALEAGGMTVAVLGCGLGTVYPKNHAGLMDAIIRNGAVLTEYPPYAAPEREHFPARNRIISGLSQAALIVEAPESSGAMITARLADSQGRALYATPGNVDSVKSVGPNKLIQDGAHTVLKGADLLESFLAMYPLYLRPEKIRRLGRCAEYDPKVFRKLHMPDYAELARASVPTETVSEPAAPVPAVQTELQPAPEVFPKAAEPAKADHSEELLAAMPDAYRKIFADLPIDGAFSVDQIVRLGYSTGELLPALTMLEVKGLIRSLPGGLYQRM